MHTYVHTNIYAGFQFVNLEQYGKI